MFPSFRATSAQKNLQRKSCVAPPVDRNLKQLEHYENIWTIDDSEAAVSRGTSVCRSMLPFSRRRREHVSCPDLFDLNDKQATNSATAANATDAKRRVLRAYRDWLRAVGAPLRGVVVDADMGVS